MSTIFFSIIIPSYNSAEWLPRTIKCIEDQIFDNWELIIIDDGSTDNTSQLILEFLEDKRINYIKQDNLGVTSARNNGICRAKGKFITFLDSDDEVTSEWLLDFYNLAERNPNAGYLSCAFYINSKKKSPKLDLNIAPHKHSSLAGSFAIKNKILKEIDGYDPVLKQSENWEMTARALEYCLKNDLGIEYTDSVNFKYNQSATDAQRLVRDRHRAEATYYLYNKYKTSGVFHYRKDGFLVSSAVNYTRVGNYKMSRKLFYKIFLNKPTLNNLSRILIFEVPFLRKRKWGRKNG